MEPGDEPEGRLDRWAEATVQRVTDCGFKGIGAWSEPVLHQYDLPMTRDLNVCTWFGGDVRQLSRPEFESQLEQVIREQVGPLRDNRNLVGYV